MMDNAADVAAAPIQVVFDPKIVKLNDIAQGDLLSQGGVAATLTKNIQNDSGGAAVQLTRPPGSPGANGSGTLLTLTFSAVAPGTTQITAPNVSLRNSTGTPAAGGSPQLTVNVK
jgi:general secretion pathway protein D